MLHSLLIFVLSLGLVLGLSGTALSETGAKTEQGLNPLPLVNPNAPLQALAGAQLPRAAAQAGKRVDGGAVYLQLSGPGNAGGSIYADRAVNIDIYYVNYDLVNKVKTVANGFRLYSPEGASWTVPVATIDPCFWNEFDLTYYVSEFSVDGNNDDTIGFLGAVIIGPGLPPGGQARAAAINTQLGSSEVGNSFCIDSCYYPPSGTWMWAYGAVGSFPPDWAGPYCWEVISPTPRNCFESMGSSAITFDPDDSLCLAGVELELSSLFSQPTVVEFEAGPYQDAQPIQTEIVQMEMSVVDPTYGPVIVRVRDDIPSTGQIDSVEVDAGGGFVSGYSWFDLYIEVELAGCDLIYNTRETPWRIEAPITGLPPLGTPYLPPPTALSLELYDRVCVHQGWLCHAELQLTSEIECEIPVGACCDTLAGDCRITTADDCVGPNEEYQGDGTSCVPNPCTCTDWTPGIDTILFSSFEIQYYDQSDTLEPVSTLYAFGVQMVVERCVPLQVAPGIFRMNTTILEFGGNGSSPLTGGPFSISLDPAQESGGYIQMCDSCNDNWAESFFGVNYVINTSLEFPNAKWTGNAQMELPCGEQWNPFPGGEFDPPNGNAYIDPRKVPFYDENGQVVGYTWKRHRVDKDPLGACCDTLDRTCRITTADSCNGPNEQYQDDNTACWPNPCICTDWTPGLDTISFSTFGIDWYDQSGSTLLGTVYAFGVDMVVQRLAPFEETPDIWRLNTQVVQFGGSGNDPLLGGPFTISLDPDNASDGFIRQCDSCDDHWAESYWNISYQINTDLPFPNNVYKGLAQMELQCDANWDPGDSFQPPDDETYHDPRKVPVIDANGDTVGYTIKQHSVYSDPPTGACCLDTLCVVMTGPECVDQGGRYQGDNAPCQPNPCGCCLPPIRGDVDWSGGIDIADLVYLVEYMFNGGPEPPCLDEADVNGDGGIDIADLVHLVDYMFNGGPTPAPCQ